MKISVNGKLKANKPLTRTDVGKVSDTLGRILQRNRNAQNKNTIDNICCVVDEDGVLYDVTATNGQKTGSALAGSLKGALNQSLGEKGRLC